MEWLEALLTVLQELEKQIANFSKDRDKHIQAAKDKVKAAKAELEKAKKELRTKQNGLQVDVESSNLTAFQRCVSGHVLSRQKAPVM